MAIRARPLFVVVLGLVVPGHAVGQGTWVPHQAPCKLSTGHFLVSGAQLHLKIAAESRFPDQRAGRLAEARSVLHRAILESGQSKNPAAWYYLGRTYAEQQDLAGADSAFRRAVELAPDCAADIAGYTGRLAESALNDGRVTWDAGHRDSALVSFRLARALNPTNAEIPFFISMLFASIQEPDSAARYLDVGHQVAGQASTPRARQAALDVARAYETRAYQEAPAAQTVARTRAARDSTARQIARDSAVFDRIMTEVGGIRSRGQRLNPQALAAFQRDSGTLATRLAGDRQALDSLRARATADSAAAAIAVAPAIRQFTAFIERYPDDGEAPLPLLRLLSAAGDRAALDTAVGRAVASPNVPGQTLVRAALTLHEDGLPAPAGRLMEELLGRNPNEHGALAVLTRVYYSTGQGPALLDVARRRITLAPLDPEAARAMALAWDLAAQGDSTRRYLALADTGLGWNVRVSAFTAGERSTSLSGYVVNVGANTRPPMELLFEFLDVTGAVVGAATAAVPALEPRARSQLAVRLDQGGAVSWRYRRH
jgi:tetratricopeptide (TPR) repeat protein